MRPIKVLSVLIACALLPITAVADSFLVKVNGKNFNRVTANIEKAGATITHDFRQIGYVAVEADPSFYQSGVKIRGVSEVLHDLTFQRRLPTAFTEFVLFNQFGNPPASGDDDFFFDLQWGHDAVNAPEAWDAGARGAGVRVAVIDGGFDLDHPDLAPNIDFGSSTDFTGEGLLYSPPDPFSHGTHTAGTIGAADNGFGTIGVAPEVSLILLKALGDSGSGSFSDVIAAVLHAADADADVISMSLGATIPRNCDFRFQGGPNLPASGCAALLNATYSAVTYAYRSGALVIASLGNSARDVDNDKSLVDSEGNPIHNAHWVEIPGMGPHHLGISATAPRGWASQNWDGRFDHLAVYSNYGKSGVDFSAPGGDFVYPGNEGCLVAGLFRPCWIIDFVFSTGNGGWYWSVGTSMAAPHAAGIAALIIGENGGEMHPADVIKEMRKRAVDYAKPGRDDFHGHGGVHSGY